MIGDDGRKEETIFYMIREFYRDSKIVNIYIYITFIIKPSRMEIIIMVFIWLAVIFRNDKLIQPVEPFYFQKKEKKTILIDIERRGFLSTFNDESEGCVLIIMDEAIVHGIQKLQLIWKEKRKQKKEEEKKKESIVTNIYLNIYKDF